MLFKGVDFWPHGRMIPIMSIRYGCILASVIAFLAAIAFLFNPGLNFGIDFKGGTLIEVKSKASAVDVGELRERLDGLGFGDVQIQGLDKPDEALIRMELQARKAGQVGKEAEEAQEAAAKKVRDALGDDLEVRRVEVVGPSVSGELKQAGIIAVAFAIIGILFYIWFRFEWQFGVAAILALIHDIIITLGVFALLRIEFGLSEVAALLTLAGYSINDTVVVFDRIRENLRRYKKMALIDLMNRSINETLSRTIVTSSTTLLAVAAIWIFGTQVIQGFAFALFFGIVIGTWSSIFVASPFLLWIGVKRDWSAEASKRDAAGAQI